MRVIRTWLVVLAVGSVGNGCSCSHNAGNSGDGGGDDMSVAIAGGDINIMPPDVTLDITPGGAAATQAYTATDKSGHDITAQAAWSVDDTSLGSFAGNTFTSNVDHGGTTLVHATNNGLSGFATVHVKLHATVPSDNCPGCP